MTLVSAVIATYDRGDFIRKAVNSALNQTYDDLEVVVVDNGSVDVREEVREYLEDPRVRIYQNGEDRGIAHAKNEACERADGEYLAFLDDDDVWKPGKIEKQVSVMEELYGDYCGVYSAGEIKRNGRAVKIERNEKRGDIFPEILAGCFVHPFSSVMVRKDAFDEVSGMDEEFQRAEDWDLIIRLAKNYKFEFISEPLIERNFHGGNVSLEKDHMVESRQLIWEKHGEDIQRYPEIEKEFRYHWMRNKGMRSIRRGERLKAARQFSSILSERPTGKNLVLLLLSVLGPTAFTVAYKVNSKIRHGI